MDSWYLVLHVLLIYKHLTKSFGKNNIFTNEIIPKPYCILYIAACSVYYVYIVSVKCKIWKSVSRIELHVDGWCKWLGHSFRVLNNNPLSLKIIFGCVLRVAYPIFTRVNPNDPQLWNRDIPWTTTLSDRGWWWVKSTSPI